MSFGLHDPHERQRRRTRRLVIRWLLGIGFIIAAGVVAYQSGSTLAEREVQELRLQLTETTERVSELEGENTELQADLILKERRIADAEQRYERDVPTGRMAALMGQVKAKLDEGVDQTRLEFLIESASKSRACDNKPVTKRFIVRTPISKGANDSVSFGKNTVTISALGESAINADGQVEGWFDPAQPITLRLTEIGGKTTVKRGKLPIHTSVVVRDKEYVYSIVASEKRGFVEVTGDRCSYP